MRTFLFFTTLLSTIISSSARADQDIQIRVSVPEQRLYLFDGEKKIATYRVSTSAFGLGDSYGSYATPLGRLVVASKVGDGAEVGAVFKGRCRTGEVCAINAAGRDPIVTRILHLSGTEKQNSHAYSRGIYIHGTADERHIGMPASYGCIRMKSSDIVKVFNTVGIGTSVEITDQRIGSGIFNFVSHSTSRTPKVATKVR